MELEDLKESWLMLNERLAQSEILNKQLLRDMIAKKAQSAHSKLLRYDLIGLIAVFIIIIILPFAKMNTVMLTSTFILLISALGIALIIQAYLVQLLLDIDLANKGIIDNVRTILRYKLVNRKNQISGAVLGLVTLAGVFFLQGDRLSLNTTIILFLIVVLLCWFFLGRVQYRFYMNNIAAIEKSLQELEDFDAE